VKKPGEPVEWYEIAFDRMYPLLYPRRDREEAERVLDCFGDLLGDAEPVLDLACGNGRYLAGLLKRKFTTFGVDLSWFMVERAVGTRRLRGKVVRGDMRRLPFRDGSFGAVLNMFTSFGYFAVDMDNLRVLHEVSRTLRHGGLFLFDFVNASRIRRQQLLDTERREKGYTICERRSIEDGRCLVKRVEAAHRRTGGTFEYEERIRLYDQRELATMLESADMVVSGVFGDYDRRPFVETESERLIMVCERQ